VVHLKSRATVIVVEFEKPMFVTAERLSSGGAGGDTQPAPDEASCESRYPALTCNDLFGVGFR